MEYKEWILKFIELIDDNDACFLSVIYTLMKRHLEMRVTCDGGRMDGLQERNTGVA